MFWGLALVYFVPSIMAWARGHHNKGAITALNVLLGWTVLGWVVALVWALTRPGAVRVEAVGAAGAVAGAPTPETHVRCPECRELVLKEARVCKHCSCKLVPQG